MRGWRVRKNAEIQSGCDTRGKAFEVIPKAHAGRAKTFPAGFSHVSWMLSSINHAVHCTDIEAVIGASLETGLEKHRRWYQIKTISRNRLGLDFEELRYLGICRDLAEPFLSAKVKERVDQSIFNFSMLLADQEYAQRADVQKRQFGHCFKGWIDYSPYFPLMEKLIESKDKGVACLVTYKALTSDRVKNHQFALNQIVSMNNVLYALGAILTDNFKNMRHLTNLAVHRMLEVTITDKKICFTFPNEDLCAFGLPWHEPRKFRIHFQAGKSAEYVRERIWSDEQKFGGF